MSDDLRILAIGAAAVFDTVLLLAMLERPNRRHVMLWMFALAGGVWLWHAGGFVQALLGGTPEPWAHAWRVAARTAMCAGLLLMPAGMIHGVLRLSRSGLTEYPAVRWIYVLVYAPVVAVMPVFLRLAQQPAEEFLVAAEPWVAPDLAWMTLGNAVGAAGYLRLRGTIRLPRAEAFFGWLAAALVALTGLVIFYLAWARNVWTPAALDWLDLAVVLSPVVPAVLFAYFVVRHHFAPLIVERSLIYGGVLLGLLLLHRVAVEHVRDRLSDRFQIDFAIVEGLLALVVILSYRPLRHRATRVARHMFGSSRDEMRQRLRRLAIELSANAGRPPRELFNWLIDALPDVFEVEYAAGCLLDENGRLVERAGSADAIEADLMAAAHAELVHAGRSWCSWSDPAGPRSSEVFDWKNASLIVGIEHTPVRGLIVLGRQSLNQPLADEELDAFVLLVEQLGAALDHSRLLAETRAAEQRAWEHEKLSMLGLLAGSIAHEIKNPLSSIRTIATVTAEDLGADHPHGEDLRLILGEIDRLSKTTAGLLDFARPATNGPPGDDVSQALERTLGVLRHLGRHRDVTLEAGATGDVPRVAASETALREILFNLVSNSIEASDRGGCVRVVYKCAGDRVEIKVSDNGPGLPEEVRRRLFEPFVTTRIDGTGLGLYTVGRRVREAGGTIECDTSPEGTTFRVLLPCCEQTPREA